MSQSPIKFTGNTYYCPNCGAEIDGYLDSFWKTPNGKMYGDTKNPERPNENTDEDNDSYYWTEVAGCIKCLDFWFKKDLKQKVVFQFR